MTPTIEPHWMRRDGGRGWAFGSGGRPIVENFRGMPQTGGPPTSAKLLFQDFGDEIAAAHERFSVIPEWEIADLCLTESVRKRGSLHRDPASHRWEPRLHTSSDGLTQTLIPTAQAINDELKIYPGAVITREFLDDPGHSIMLGTGDLVLMVRYPERYGHPRDAFERQAAYCHGRVSIDPTNEFRIVMTPGRDWNWLRWAGDVYRLHHPQQA